METLIANLRKHKSKNALKEIHCYIIEKDINDYIKYCKELIDYLVNNKINEETQSSILLFFIDLFFSFTLKSEQINQIPIENIFSSNHPLYLDINFDNLISLFFNIHYPKDDVLFQIGNKVDYLYIEEDKYYLWVQGEIISVNTQLRQYEIKIPCASSVLQIDFDSYKIQEMNTFTKEDYQWRINVSKGDIIDALNNQNWWNKVIIESKEGEKIAVKLKTKKEDDQIPVGYDDYQKIVSIYDSRIRKSNTFSFNIPNPNSYSFSPNTKFNSLGMFIPFDNKHYIIPKKYEGITSYSMHFISLSNIFISKLNSTLEKKQNVFTELYYFDYFYIINKILYQIHEHFHPEFAKIFIPNYISKSKDYLILFSKSENHNFSKASIETLIQNLKTINQMAYYQMEINQLFNQFELSFGLSCFKSSTILEKQLLGLKILGETLKERANHIYPNIVYNELSLLLQMKSNTNNLFDLFFNSRSHSEIIKKSSDILLPLFKLKLISKENIDYLYEYTQLTTVKEIREIIYVILSKSGPDLTYELIEYTMNKVFSLPQPEITTNDILMLMELSKVIPSTYMDNTVYNLLNLIFDLIMKHNFSDLIRSFCEIICYPDKFEDLINFFLTFSDRLIKSLSIQDLYTQIAFLSRLVQCVPKVLEKDIIPKMANQIFLSSKELCILIVDFCINPDNIYFIDILSHLLHILIETNNSNFLTTSFIKSLFDIFSNENHISNKFFFEWLRDLQDKQLLRSNLIEYLFSLLQSYLNQHKTHSVNKEMMKFFWNLFLFVNSINEKCFKSNSNNPFEMKYVDIIWYYLINSKKEETFIDNFIDLFALPWQTQVERSKIWQEVIRKTFEDMNSDNKINCIRILNNLIEVSDSYGTAGCKPHSSLIDKYEMTIKILNETDKKNAQRFELKISSSITLYDLKLILSEKIKIPLLSFATYRFYTSELPSKYNGKTIGSLFLNNGQLVIKNHDNFTIEKKPLLNKNRSDLSPESKNALTRIFKLFSTNNKMNKDQCMQFVSSAVGSNSKVDENDHNVKIFFEKYNTDKDRLLTLDGFLSFYYNAAINNKEDKIFENLKEFNFRNDFTHITEPYAKEPFINNDKTLMPRYILSKNYQLFNTIFDIQNDTKIDISDNASGLINLIETKEELYNEIISYKCNDYLTNAKDNIFKMIYIIQIIASIIDNIEEEKEKKWLNDFVSSTSAEDSSKKSSSLEHIIDIFINQMEHLVDDNKTMIRLYTVELQLIKISLTIIINNKDLIRLLLHFEKSLETEIPVINIRELASCLKTKPNLQLLNIAKIIIKNMPILNNKDKYLCFKKDSMKYSFEILIIIILEYGLSDSNDVISLNLNDFLHNQLKVPFPYAQRFSYLTIKILFMYFNQKDNFILFFKRCEKLIRKEIYGNNKTLNEYNPFFVFNVYLHFIQMNPLSQNQMIEIIQLIMNELKDKNNKYSEDILIGYYSVLIYIITTIDSIPDITNSIIPILTNRFLINDIEDYYPFSSEKYIKSILELISLLISKSSNNLISFYFNQKIIDLESHISQLTDDKKLYNPSQECKSKTKYVGIKNLSAICYMISIIQQFYIVKSFRYCINGVSLPENQDTPLYQLQKMFTFLELSNRKDYSPKEFAHSFKDIEGNPIDIREQCDAQEFLSRFMDQIEESLKNTSYKYFLSGIFKGENCSQLFCKNPDCDKISNRFENLSYLSLEIKHLSTLHESLKKYISEDQIDDFYCDKCKMKMTHSKRVSINKLPNVLLIHLQRIAFDYETFQMEKIYSKLEFPRDLNMKEYCTEILQENKIEDEDFKLHVNPHIDDYYQYKLKGIVVHTGTAQFGHYFSLVNVNSIDQKENWIKLNDSVTSDYSIDKLEEDTFGEGSSFKKGEWSIDTHQNAYILLYERKKKTQLPCVINQPMSYQDNIINVKDDTHLIKELDILIKTDKLKQKEDNKIEETKAKMYCINKTDTLKEYIEIIDYDVFVKNESTKEEQKKLFYENVIIDNIKFNNDKKIFTNKFSELIEVSAKQLHTNKEISEENAIKLYVIIHNIILKIISKSNFKDNLYKIIPELIETIKQYPKLISILLKEIQESEDNWITPFLLIQDTIISSSFALYISKIIISSISLDINSNIAYSLIDSYLAYIPIQLSRKWNQMYYFLELLNNLSKSEEPKIVEYLIGRETIGKLCDFFLGKESPLYKGDNRTEIGNKTVKGKFGPLLSSISNLLYYNHNNPPNQNETKCLLLKNFYLKALKEESNNSAMSKIIAYYMLNNLDFTLSVLNNLIPIINTATSISNVKNILILIQDILAITDNYTIIRLENLIGIPQFTFDGQRIFFSFYAPLINDKETIITKILNNFTDTKDYLTFVDFIYNLMIDNPLVFNYFKNLPHISSGLINNGLIKTIHRKCINLIDTLNLRNDENYKQKIDKLENLHHTIDIQLIGDHVITEDEQIMELIPKVMRVEKENVKKLKYVCEESNLKKNILVLESKCDIVDIEEEEFNSDINTIAVDFIDINSYGSYLNNVSKLLNDNIIIRQLPALHLSKSYNIMRYFLLNTSKEYDQQIILKFSLNNHTNVDSQLPKSEMTINVPKQSISEIISLKKSIDNDVIINIKSLIQLQSKELQKEEDIKTELNKIEDVCAIICQICGETNVIDNSNNDLQCKSCQGFLFN